MEVPAGNSSLSQLLRRPPGMGDLTQLHQVLLNLAVNARDAMPEGGTLTLAARNQPVSEGADPVQVRLRPGDYVALTVTDTGSGIPPEVLEHIFEPFFTTKPRGKGTGLGLSTVYGIVNSHGGTINVHTQLGQGTTFEILLPAAPGTPDLGTPTTRPPALLGAGRRVLVVDDEEPIRTMTARVLTEHGFNVVTAADGCEGWREFQAHPDGFAAAIVDVMMPRMNGTELAQKMHAVAPDLPIIIVTGIMSSDTLPPGEVDWKSMGVRLVLNKPYGQPELVKALDGVLAPSRTS